MDPLSIGPPNPDMLARFPADRELVAQSVPIEGEQAVKYDPLPSKQVIPASELTATVLLGALLAILGNNLLKPLLAIILSNLKSDSEAPDKMIGILKERLDVLEHERAEFLKVFQDMASERKETRDLAKSQTEEVRTFRETVDRHSDLLVSLVESLTRVEEVMISNQTLLNTVTGDAVKAHIARALVAKPPDPYSEVDLANATAQPPKPVLRAPERPYHG